MYMNNENRIESHGGEVCVINHHGSIVVKPQVAVDALYYPSHGFCQVEKAGKFGYINERGKLVIPFKYEKAFPFSENGLAFVVGENGLGGYINRDDEFIIDPIYDTGSHFRFGFAAVSRDGSYEYIYANGMKAVNHTFKYASGFSECGLAKVVTFDDRHQLMDMTSLVVLKLKANCELAEFKEGVRLTKFSSGGREAMIDAAGNIVTGFYDHIIISSYAHRHPFLKNGLWGYLDNLGYEVIPNIYKEVSEFAEDGIAHVKAFHPLAENNEQEFYINKDDEILDTAEIESKAKKFSKKYATVHRFKKCLALAKIKSKTAAEKDVDERKATEVKQLQEEREIFYDLYDDMLGVTVKTAIDEFDPYVVLPGEDAPFNEYDRESMIIASKIKSNMSEKEIATVIADVFSRWFNTMYLVEDCLTPAREIYQYVSKQVKR